MVEDFNSSFSIKQTENQWPNMFNFLDIHKTLYPATSECAFSKQSAHWALKKYNHVIDHETSFNKWWRVGHHSIGWSQSKKSLIQLSPHEPSQWDLPHWVLSPSPRPRGISSSKGAFPSLFLGTIMVPWKWLQTNPQNLSIRDLTRKEELANMVKLRILSWGDYPELSRWAQRNCKGFNKGEAGRSEWE